MLITSSGERSRRSGSCIVLYGQHVHITERATLSSDFEIDEDR